MKKASDTTQLAEKVEDRRAVSRSTRRSSCSRSPPARSSTRPSRSSFRLGVDPRHSDQQLRGTVVTASRDGPDGQDPGPGEGREGRRGRGGRSGLRRRRGLHREDQGRLARGRHGHRHARHDEGRRQAGQDPRSEGAHAQSEDGYRDLRHRQGGHRSQGRQGRVSDRQDRQRARRVSARSRSRPDKLKGNLIELTREVLRAKPPAAKGIYMKKRHHQFDDGAGHRPRHRVR